MINAMKKLQKNFHFILLFFVVFGNISFSFGQTVKRTLSAVNSDYDCGMSKMATIHNQLYVFGFGGTNLQFRGTKSIQSNGARQLFVSKYNDTGLYLKSVVFGGTGANLNGDACAFGNQLTSYSGTFSGGYAENNISYQPTSKKGMFVTTLDSALKTSWRLFINANGNFHCNLICPDGKGNLFAAGYFTDSLIAGGFQFASKRTANQLNKSKDIFLVLINASGNIIKAQIFGGVGNDYPTAITTDSRGNAIISAIISDTVTIGDYYYPQQSNSRCIVFKANMDGHTSWITSFVGAGAMSNGIEFNKNNQIVCGVHFKSALYVKSKFKSTKLNSSSEYNQIGVILLDTFGALQNYKTEGSANECNLTTLNIDPNNNIYIAGEFTCTFNDFKLKNTSWSFTNFGFGDIYIAAYKSDLTSLYQRQIGGTEKDFANHLIYWNNKPVLCGNFKNNFQLTCDSNVTATTNIWSNYQLNRDYYKANSQNHNNIMSLDYEMGGLVSYCGFFTDIIDSKSKLFNVYQRTNIPQKPYAENAFFSILDTVCGSSYLRFLWMQHFTYNTRWGGNLQFQLNGRSYTYDELVYNYRFDKTTTHKLVLTTLDQCYSDSMSKTHVVLPPDDVQIKYDKIKYPQDIVLCNNDSICLTASNTKGLKYHWIVLSYGYVLDTSNFYNKGKTWIYNVVRKDTIRKATICINKKATVLLEVEQNNICLNPSSLKIEKDSLGTDDSLIFAFKDTNSYFCKGIRSPIEIFQIKVIDKKTGYYRNPEMTVTAKINGFTYGSSLQTEYYVSIPDTGKISVSGTVQIGCEVYPFSVSRKIHLYKPKMKLTGTLSNCRSLDRIFSVDSGFINYQWSVGGMPDTPKITYIKPWKIKVSGSSQSISIMAFADTNKGRVCYLREDKYVYANKSITIASSLNPPQLCPNTTITLTAGNAKDYRWFPTGETTKAINVSEPGIYYCTVTDTGDCQYMTNKIEVLGYFVPDILVAPDDGICKGKYADILVIAPKFATVNWTNPTAWGSKLQINTNQLGIFNCDVKICNTTFKLKAQLTAKVLENQTLNFNYKLCQGQTLKLTSHDSETYAYLWNPTNKGTRSINVNTTGIYIAQAKDICDNWYDSDVFTIEKSNSIGKSGALDTLICNSLPTTVDLTKFNLNIDSNVTCKWLDNLDTSLKRTFSAGGTNVMALLKNKLCSVPDTFKVNINRHKVPIIKLNSLKEVCKGDTLKLEVQLNDTNAKLSEIRWNQNLGSGPLKYLTVNVPQWVVAKYKDTCALIADSVYVVPIVVKAAFTMNYDGIEDSLTFDDKSLGPNISLHRWYIQQQIKGQDKVLKISRPEILKSEVCLFIKNLNGCKDSICKIIPSYGDGHVYIPTAFRPGSKISANQRFEPRFNKLIEYKMEIYNRWGEKLFEGNNSTMGWDGSYMGMRCISGYYVYLITVKYENKNNIPQTETYKGTFMLLE
jgi:gliding motility-associated-like protein